MTDGVDEAHSESTPGGSPAAPARRPYVRRALLGMAVGLVVVLVGVATWVFPYYRDDRLLDRIVRIVALDWRDFGEATAKDRLDYEIDRAGIGLWVADDACQLTEGDESKEVRCAWAVPIRAFGFVVPLKYESRARIGPDGDLD